MGFEGYVGYVEWRDDPSMKWVQRFLGEISM